MAKGAASRTQKTRVKILKLISFESSEITTYTCSRQRAVLNEKSHLLPANAADKRIKGAALYGVANKGTTGMKGIESMGKSGVHAVTAAVSRVNIFQVPRLHGASLN
jgi:hypothetical protein